MHLTSIKPSLSLLHRYFHRSQVLFHSMSLPSKFSISILFPVVTKLSQRNETNFLSQFSETFTNNDPLEAIGETIKFNRVLLLVGALWMISSAIFSTYANSAFINHFRDPILHNFVRFGGSTFFGSLAALTNQPTSDGNRQPTLDSDTVSPSNLPHLIKQAALPALFLWLANYFNSVSLKRSGITLTYVMKACIPVFTVMICRFQGMEFPLSIYSSLIPVCFGVILASGSDLDFTFSGFCAALASAISQTLLNITAKNARNKSGYSGRQLFLGMAFLCFMFSTTILAISSLQSHSTSTVALFRIFSDALKGQYWPLWLSLLAAVTYFVEYSLNFIFVGYVNTLTFSVCDITRRIAIIVVGAFLFDKKLTASNMIGIVLALGGVLGYSFLDARRKAKFSDSGKL